MKSLKIFRSSTWRRAIMWSSFQLIRVTCWSLCSQKLLWESKKEDARGVPPLHNPKPQASSDVSRVTRIFGTISIWKITRRKYTTSETVLWYVRGTSVKRHFPMLKPRDHMATCFWVCPEVGCTRTGLKWKQEVDLHKQYHFSQKDKLARIAALLARWICSA